MNARQRQIAIERDQRECVNCHGTCPYQKGGKCLLPLKTLSAERYWKLDAQLPPIGRLQVDHVYGKSRESWNEVATLCPCCHSKKVQGGGAVYEAEVAYLATLGAPPKEYVEEQLKEAMAKPKRKAKKKAARKALYQKTVAKHGTPAIPSRAPKRKKGTSKWDWAPIQPRKRLIP